MIMRVCERITNTTVNLWLSHLWKLGWLTSVLFILISGCSAVADLIVKLVCLHCVSSDICAAVLQGLLPPFHDRLFFVKSHN